MFLGSLLGDTSPVPTHTPLLGAELLLDPGDHRSTSTSTRRFEHGVLVDTGVVAVGAGRRPSPATSPTSRPAGPTLRLVGRRRSRCGCCCSAVPPFGESIVMWWNFVGRSHDEIVGYREEWQAQITRDGEVVPDSRQVAPGRFGVVDHPLPPIPAPPLPNARLRERR